MDEWWEKVEPILLQRFQQHRDAGAVVHYSHLIVFVLEISAELGIDLTQIERERGWKDLHTNIRLRVSKFCVRNKIRMKRASRQVNKDPKVRVALFLPVV